MAREILIRIDGDSSGLSKSLGDADRDTARFAGEVKGHFGGMLSSVASVATAIAGLSAVRFAGGQLIGSVAAASDLAETTSKVGVLFGDSADEVESFADSAARAFGQSKQEALDAAAAFAVFGKSAGLSGKDLVGFSTDLTGLASDMASFSNTSTTEAIEAIGAALRGEAEPIRRYGVLLDAAALEDEALRLGLIKTRKEALTPQMRVLAANSAIYRQTSAAQGDFKRTSQGLANQQRILKAEFANVKTEIGQGLLPIALGLTQWANDALIPALDGAGPKIAGFAKSVQTAVGALADGLRGEGVTTEGWIGKFELVGALARQVFDAVREAATATVDWIVAHWPQIVQTFEQVGPPLAAAAASAATFMAIMRATTTVRAGAAAALQFAGALGPWGLGIAAVSAGLVALYKHSDSFRRFVDGLVQSGKALFAELSAVFKSDGLGAALKLLGEKIWKGVRDGFAYIVDHAPEWWSAFVGWLESTALPWVSEKGTALARLLSEWVGHAAKWLADNLPGWLAALASWMVGTVLPWLGEKAGELAEKISGWVAEGARKLREKLPKWVEEFLAWTIGEAIPALAKFGLDAAAKLADWVGEAAVKLIKALPGWILAFAVWVAVDALPAMAKNAGRLADAFFDAFMGALGFAWDIGAAIIKGIVEGLWDLGSWMAGEVKKLVTQYIPGPIRDVLGISSPSKVTMEMGRQVMDGLRLGMEQNVMSLAHSTELSMTAGLVAPASAVASSVGGEASPEMRPVGAQTVIVQLDGREIARALVPHQRSIVRAAG